MPFLVRCPIGIDCILDLMFPAHLSLGCNYAGFPYFYLKPPAGHCANLATVMRRRGRGEEGRKEGEKEGRREERIDTNLFFF
jgi:hypothetical protein